MESFDFRAPDYAAVIRERVERLSRLRARPDTLPALQAFYRDHPGHFLTDWGMTSDPRNRGKAAPIELPFVLFPRQHQMLDFMLERMAACEPGLIEKSRDCGASWLLMCLAVTLCLFNRGVVVGIGSSKEDKIDRSGDPDCLFWKAKFFLAHLPPEFRGAWDESRHSAHLRIVFPDTGSAIVGEAGDQIGRGGRSTLYVLDEAAFLERPAQVDASLASNTECRIDVSTPNGPANSFATRRQSGKIKVFTFHWREDPRKDDAWYQRQCEILDPITRRQEIDLDYQARTEGVLLPHEWVNAAIGAHTRLKLEVTGERRGALDVADEGRDLNCFAGRYGILLERLQAWSGKGSDIYQTVVRAFGLCEEHGYRGLDYDADGLGAGVRGDAANINQVRREASKPEIAVEAFRGSGGVFDPDGSLVEGRLNKDYFANLKAQSWWALRLRFQHTYRAVVEGMPYDPAQLVAIDPNLPELAQLVTELSQPTYTVNAVGKIVIDKAPDGAASPNRADALMIAFSPYRLQAYFAPATATRSSAQPTPTQQGLPKLLDGVYAVLCASDAETSVAVVYFGMNRSGDDGTRGAGFWVLDWDLRAADQEAALWMVDEVPRRLEALGAEIGVLLPDAARIWSDTFVSTRLLQEVGYPAESVPTVDFPEPAERLAAARPFLNYGQVAVSAVARERLVSFRGARRNFLMEALSLATVTDRNPLALALATGVLLGLQGGVAAVSRLPAEATPEEVPPVSAPAPYVPSVHLRVGVHVIDGERVEVPGGPGQDFAHYPLSPGRHVIDDIQHIVPRWPGIRVA